MGRIIQVGNRGLPMAGHRPGPWYVIILRGHARKGLEYPGEMGLIGNPMGVHDICKPVIVFVGYLLKGFLKPNDLTKLPGRDAHLLLEPALKGPRGDGKPFIEAFKGQLPIFLDHHPQGLVDITVKEGFLASKTFSKYSAIRSTAIVGPELFWSRSRVSRAFSNCCRSKHASFRSCGERSKKLLSTKGYNWKTIIWKVPCIWSSMGGFWEKMCAYTQKKCVR